MRGPATFKLAFVAAAIVTSPSGVSFAEDDLVIDLSRYFNYAVVDPEKHAARVGGRSLSLTVEDEAIKVRFG
jgi:hypothetical protein